jgi:hypothetical protein
MCIACDQLPSLEHWTTFSPGKSTDGRSQHFHRQLACLKSIGEHYGLDIYLALAGSAYVTSDKKGHTVVCRNVDEVWNAVTLMIGERPDPLDVDLLARFQLIRRGRTTSGFEKPHEP